jgi:hypothetical protein
MTFNLFVTTPASQPDLIGYLTDVIGRADEALRKPSIEPQDAWALCEYLDCADAGDIDFDRPTYRQATAALGEYLSDASTSEGLELAKKSWAAKTLLELLQGPSVLRQEEYREESQAAA